MSETTMTTTTSAPPVGMRTERVAWGVLLIAFAVFLLSCLLTTLAVYWFFFQSTVPMTVIAEVSRGTVGVTRVDLREEIARPTQPLNVGNVVRPTDPQSQATVMIRDPYNDNAVAASLTLNTPATLVSLRSALRPRFHWNSNPYQIEMTVDGDIDIYVVPNLPNEMILDLIARDGTRIRLGDEGHYTIISDGNGLRVMNYDGEVVVIPSGGSVGWPVARGSAVQLAADATEPQSAYMPVNLLENNYFNETLAREDDAEGPIFGGDVQVYENRPLLSWTCWMGPQNDPPGRILTGKQDGRAIVQMVRGNEAQSSGGTYCQQGYGLGDPWIDVTGYDYLAFRTTFYIQYQSLSVCGDRASECPLMVRLDYIDANGEEGHLIYGFYFRLDPTRENRLTCDSCRQPHVQVREQSWFTFESENLLELFPEGERPAVLSRIQFYASGHEFDMRISELSLMAAESPVNAAAAMQESGQG